MAVTAQVVAGSFHSVALRTDGSLWAWGINSEGELGDGTATDRHAPVLIGTGFVSVAAGFYHTVAIKSDGSLWAWGYNYYGQLGNGTTTNQLSPVLVGSGFSAAAAGQNHTVALKADGSLWTWGDNGFGQLGDGTTANRSTPQQIGTGYSAVAAGYSHTVAVKADGSLWAWGHNGYGQLGDGSTNSGAAPVAIGTGFASVAAGSFHTLALKTDGTLWAWGYNADGELGDGTTTNRLSPVQIGAGYSSVVSGNFQSFAFKADGSLWAWGTNQYGQLGDGTTTSRVGPVQIGAGYTALASGLGHAAALRSDGGLWAWGWNNYGQLGDGAAGLTLYQPVPVQVAAFSAVVVTPINFAPGWNLAGNSNNAALDVAAAFGSTTNVTSVWKWIPATGKWAFYAPSLVGQALIDYAASKGHDVLSTINGGEGFWVNARANFTVQLPTGAAITSASFQPPLTGTGTLSQGWNLIAIGDNKTPSDFNKTLSVDPPAPGDIPINLTTLWAWDNGQGNWYFYAPNLEKSGELSAYIQSKYYLDFGTRTLGPTTGFWVNRP
ncbi:MAG: hypothetical protein HYU75_21060 [Betaproteobacteria bacterium]|nr:hypothetical protein [Betaproteobacteria bacterium]